MAGVKKSNAGFKLFLANPQLPAETNQPLLLEPQPLGPNNVERKFISQKIKGHDTGSIKRKPQKHDSSQILSRPIASNKFQWFSSSATGEPGSQVFHPPKRRRMEKEAKLRLNGRSPLKMGAAVNEDVWRIIFSFCDPKLLLSMRYVCRMFRHILKENRIWKESREIHLGDDMPSCPFFLTEMQYVDLLVGTGCQSSYCLRRETRKANWIFRGRLCEACLRQKTSTNAVADEFQSSNLYPELLAHSDLIGLTDLSYLDLIPTAYHESGKYYAPRRIDPNTGQWYGATHRGHGLLYLTSDYQKLVAEVSQIQQESWSLQKALDWAKDKYEVALRYGKVAEELGHWEISKPSRWDLSSTRAQSERERETFFIRKAAEASVNIAADVLPFFAAYQSALLTLNKPSERCWQLLLPKILPYKDEAERVQRYQVDQPKCHIRNQESEWSEDAKLYKKLHDHRHVSHVETGQWTPEQTFVRDIGRAEFSRLDGNVADEDLVLLCLRNVYDHYQKLDVKPQGLNFDGVQGIYKLSLDDARMVVEDIIQPELDRKTLRSVKVLRSFKCAGCNRTDVARKFTFRSCFEHIRIAHSTRVGKGLAFSRFARNSLSTTIEHLSPMYSRGASTSAFPWYILEWTRTLPVLPLHTSVTKKTVWDPDSNGEYQQMNQKDVELSAGLFDGRRAVPIQDLDSSDFCASFVHAITMFKSTMLDAASVVKIALHYALDIRDETTAPSARTELTRENFLEYLKDARAQHPSLVFKFRCGVCSRQPDADKHTRCARTPVDLTKLENHWLQKHRDESYETSADLICLPSDAELLRTMHKHDINLKDMKDQSVQRESIGLRKTYRKKPDSKASILMNKPMCLDVFDALFTTDDVTQVDLAAVGD